MTHIKLPPAKSPIRLTGQNGFSPSLPMSYRIVSVRVGTFRAPLGNDGSLEDLFIRLRIW